MFGSKAPGAWREELSKALPFKTWVLIKVGEAVGRLREISFCQAAGGSTVRLRVSHIWKSAKTDCWNWKYNLWGSEVR